MRPDCPVNTLHLVEVCALAGTRLIYFSVFLARGEQWCEAFVGFFIARVFFSVFSIYGLLIPFFRVPGL